MNVLHSSSRASSRSRSSHSANSSSRSTSARPGQQPAGLELDERGGDQQELGGDVEVEGLHPLDLDQIGVDDPGQVDLVDVDLLGQDQLQEQVERTLVGPVGQLGRDIDRHGRRRYWRVPTGGGWSTRVLSPSERRAAEAAQQTLREPATLGIGTLSAVTRVLSCMQPTGDVHLGNYLGALRPWVAGQHDHDAFHGIVDLHALTVTEEPGVVGERTVQLAAMFFAVGLDPDVATVFVQSHVPEHSQLAWIMECTVSYGELSRMIQFKDKSAKREGEFISAGLFTYPALQAADILLYDADDVPVGDDQRQHVEITRDIAIRFNHRFGETFVLPEAVTPTAGARVMDLQDPTSKMSKSAATDAGLIQLMDDPASIARKFKRAVTDSETEVRYDPAAKPGVSNLLDILGAATGQAPADLAEGYTQYGPLKQDAGDAVVELLAPIQAPLPRAARRPRRAGGAAAQGRGQGPRGRGGDARSAPTTPSACSPPEPWPSACRPTVTALEPPTAASSAGGPGPGQPGGRAALRPRRHRHRRAARHPPAGRAGAVGQRARPRRRRVQLPDLRRHRAGRQPSGRRSSERRRRRRGPDDLARLIVGLLVAPVVGFGAPALARALGGSGEVLDHATTYLRISAVGLPFILVTLGAQGVHRGASDYRRPLVVLLAANARERRARGAVRVRVRLGRARARRGRP